MLVELVRLWIFFLSVKTARMAGIQYDKPGSVFHVTMWVWWPIHSSSRRNFKVINALSLPAPIGPSESSSV
ncbi:hypothetical protein C8F04DRAFT_327927 [Mycena alexandri]|uniref:Secreted protein n=1 Tax=Mycena alexandri TaxID=1745969 RepID=A0AAD6WMH8_9AGAR|nr:hypothetical protein C8F04DRAFT_327927 [Mycena alexandri]